MSRLVFRLQPIPTASGSVVRLDTASGSNTPADVRTLGGNVIDGAIIRSGSHAGALPSVLGPDGVTTLYQKTLDYRGQVTGSPVTLTGEDDNPSAPTGGAATTNASLLTSGTLSAARLPDLSGIYAVAVVITPTGAADDTAYVQGKIDGSSAGDTVMFHGLLPVSAPIKYRENRTYIGTGSAYGATSGLRLISGSNPTGTGRTGIFVPYGWTTNKTTNDAPVVIENLHIDGNKAGNPSSNAHGIILCNYWSRIEGCSIIETPKDGIHLTDVTANNSSQITNSASENKLLYNRVQNPGGHGISQRCANTISNQDGFCEGNLIDNPGLDGINYERGSGWLVRRNHIYPNVYGGPVNGSGITLDNCYATVVVENEIETFGHTGGNGAFYAGIKVVSLAGRGTVVSHNFIGCAETDPTSHYQYINVTAAINATTAAAIVTDNFVNGPASPTSAGLGYVLDSNGGTGKLTAVFDGNNLTNVQNTSYVNPANVITQQDRNGVLRPVSGTLTTRNTGAAVGTGAPALGGSGNDIFGTITFGTGTATATGKAVGLVFTTPYAAAPAVTVSGNAAAQALGLSVDSYTWGVDVNVAVAPGVSRAAGSYVVHYRIDG